MGKNDLVVPKNWGIRKKHLDSLPYHELKSTGLGMLGADWNMRKAIESVAAQS